MPASKPDLRSETHEYLCITIDSVLEKEEPAPLCTCIAPVSTSMTGSLAIAPGPWPQFAHIRDACVDVWHCDVICCVELQLLWFLSPGLTDAQPIQGCNRPQ